MPFGYLGICYSSNVTRWRVTMQGALGMGVKFFTFVIEEAMRLFC